MQAPEVESFDEEEAPAIDMPTRNAGEFHIICKMLLCSYILRAPSPIDIPDSRNHDSYIEWKRASLAPESRALIRELAANKRELAHVSRQIEKQVMFGVFGRVDSCFRRSHFALAKLSFSSTAP